MAPLQPTEQASQDPAAPLLFYTLAALGIEDPQQAMGRWCGFSPLGSPPSLTSLTTAKYVLDMGWKAKIIKVN